MLTRFPSLDVFFYFFAIMMPPFAPSALRYMLPITIAPGYVQMIGMITAGLLMGLFIAVGFVQSVYLVLVTLYMSFLLASQITLPGPSYTHTKDAQELPVAGWGILALAFLPCYLLTHGIIYAVLRMICRPRDLGGFETAALSFIDYLQVVYRAVTCRDTSGSGIGSEIGFGPDQEAFVSPPSYEVLTQCDIDVINSPFSSSSCPQASLKSTINRV